MKHAYLFAALAALLGNVCTAATPAQQPAAKPHASSDQGPEVAYADIGKYVGKRIVVHTKLNTTRTGVLLRQSATEIDIKLDGGAELSITAESIRRLVVPVAPPDPLVKPVESKPADAKASDVKPADNKPAGSKPADGKTGDDSAKKK
jgi:hypothetical protein